MHPPLWLWLEGNWLLEYHYHMHTLLHVWLLFMLLYQDGSPVQHDCVTAWGYQISPRDWCWGQFDLEHIELCPELQACKPQPCDEPWCVFSVCNSSALRSIGCPVQHDCVTAWGMNFLWFSEPVQFDVMWFILLYLWARWCESEDLSLIQGTESTKIVSSVAMCVVRALVEFSAVCSVTRTTSCF